MFKTTFHFSIFIAFLLSPGIVSGQVTGVKYFIKHNTKTNLYDCHLIITEGSATSTIHRTQFNAQYSIVAPSGSIMQIAERYFPLQDHQTYTGTKPCEWKIASVIRTPEVTPDKDYFGIVPTLGPSAQYDNIKAGDTIKIFSISVEPKPKIFQKFVSLIMLLIPLLQPQACVEPILVMDLPSAESHSVIQEIIHLQRQANRNSLTNQK